MTKALKKEPRQQSPRTRALIKDKALVQGELRAEEIVEKVRAAMKLVEGEITTNDGVYPGNKGGLSLNEIARRADVNNTTLYGAKYKVFREEINTWLKAIKSTAVTGRMRVRKEVTTRVAEWRELYDGLVESNRISELHLQEATSQLEAARVDLAELRRENERLRRALTVEGDKKVVALRSRKD